MAGRQTAGGRTAGRERARKAREDLRRLRAERDAAATKASEDYFDALAAHEQAASLMAAAQAARDDALVALGDAVTDDEELAALCGLDVTHARTALRRARDARRARHTGTSDGGSDPVDTDAGASGTPAEATVTSGLPAGV